METLVKKYLSLIDDIIVDFLGDIKSLRYQLILAGFAFNIWLFKHDAPASVMLASIGLLTLIFGMYFQSKKQQAELEAKQTSEDGDPKIERNPEL